VDVLRLGARVLCDPADDRRLAAAAARIDDWSGLPTAAEAHGLAPLLSLHLARAGARMPVEIRQELVGLALHHREANRVRFHVLREVLDALEAASIPVLVLKGAALAHLLYPSPGLRPLSDLDLLVAPRLSGRAQSVLAEIGFRAPLSPTSRALAAHHHLPVATRFCDGQIVHVEIHRDALTRDTRESLSMDRLSSAPQPFEIEGRPASTLGHADMLRHLSRHVAECALLLRLIWVVDIVGYATRYREAIPWAELRERHPFVLNTLSLLHLVTPLPPELLEYVTPARAEGLRGIGISCKPLGEIVKLNRPVRAIARDVFDPSDWWLRLYYGLGDESPLWWHRRVTHPLRLGYWLSRRAVASVRWSVRGA
jgi:putative nucleotidyltransferase-like protein